MVASGSVDVGDISYMPSIRDDVESNQIAAPEGLDITIDPDVADHFRDALIAELKFIGIKVYDSEVTLRGRITQLDWRGFSKVGTLTTIYTVINSDSEVMFTKKIKTEVPVKVQRPFNRFLARITKANIEELVSNPEFLQAVN
jgi:hypothetical protein